MFSIQASSAPGSMYTTQFDDRVPYPVPRRCRDDGPDGLRCHARPSRVHHVAKVGVAGSNPVLRSKTRRSAGVLIGLLGSDRRQDFIRRSDAVPEGDTCDQDAEGLHAVQHSGRPIRVCGSDLGHRPVGWDR